MQEEIRIRIAEIEKLFYELPFEVECIENKETQKSILNNLKRVEVLSKAIYDYAIKKSDEEFEIRDNQKLLDADPNCKHEIQNLSSGVKCKKCSGWFCY